MPRLRLGVALLVPEPAAAEIDGLRRALGDGALGRIPAHLTLVPPVNVPEDRLPEALAVLRAAAAGAGGAGRGCGPGPLRLRLGPPATFHPVTPVVYLPVDGDVDQLRALRDRVFRPPLERTLTHEFVPHVTLADDLAPERIPAALAALADARLDVTVDRVHLLREEPGRVWRPIADAPLAPATVVGRGGLPLEVTVSERLDPEGGRLLAWAFGRPPPGEAAPVAGAPATEMPGAGAPAADGPTADASVAGASGQAVPAAEAPAAGGTPGGPACGGGGRDAAPTGQVPAAGAPGDAAPRAEVPGDGPGGAFGPLAVTARRDGEMVGAAHGWTVGPLTLLSGLAVVDGARRQGVGAHLLAAVEGEARARGSLALEALAPDDPAATALLAGAGWKPVGPAPLPTWCRWHRPLVAPSA